MNTRSPLTKKRKLATVVAPPEDVVNEIQLAHPTPSRSSGDERIDDNPPSASLNGASFKVINDPIHGHIELHPLCIKIVDTPQFQRLRNIKQLGGCYFVFPGASHNRFEHSLGVAYLATKLCKRLRKTQPHLGITDQELLCIQIAGLCHDLGHGPFSHLFDGIFLPKARPGIQWKHEIGSGDMLEHLIKENNLMEEFEKWKLSEKDIGFIKALILGEPSEDSSKPYLFEIVANKRTGIDVDKWDYFARDCYHLGISNNFDYKRYMKFARVVRADGQLQICTREKEVGALYDMFHTRNSLHRRAYQHKTAKIIDTMIVDALLKADPFIWLPGKDGRIVKISEAIDDMHAYTHLTDSILHQIELTRDPRLVESQNILKRVQTRDLYSLVGQTILRARTDIPQDELCAEILDSLEPMQKANFHIQVIEFDYGMKDLNPIDRVRFYGKDDLKEASKLRKDQVSQMLPEKFAEQHLRFYCRFKIPELISKGKSVFKSWCNATGNSPTKDEGLYPELTPSKQSVSSSLASSSSSESGKSRRRLNQSSEMS